MEKEGLFTTVVGSLPLENTQENMRRGFEDLINIGIDYPCYPQLESMITQFLEPLSEVIDPLTKKDDKFYLSEDFDIPSKNVALEYGEFIINFLNGVCMLKPFCLASSLTNPR